MTRPVSDAVLADAGRTLAEAVREAYQSRIRGTDAPVAAALAAYDATVTPPPAPSLSVVLPDTYLPRNVTLRTGRDGSRWIAEAEDINGQLFDVTFAGLTGRVRCATKAATVAMIERHGGTVGGKVWATPGVVR